MWLPFLAQNVNEAPFSCKGLGRGTLQTLFSFLGSLTSSDADGRIILDPQAGTCKFILLNAAAQVSKARPLQPVPQLDSRMLLKRLGIMPEVHASHLALQDLIPSSFYCWTGFLHVESILAQDQRLAHRDLFSPLQILESAHAVVLASGTLAPTASLQRQLFPCRQVQAFSCGHVISRDRLLALALGHGPSGAALKFKHAHRSQAQCIEQLGRLLLNVRQAVPQVRMQSASVPILTCLAALNLDVSKYRPQKEY